MRVQDVVKDRDGVAAGRFWKRQLRLARRLTMYDCFSLDACFRLARVRRWKAPAAPRARTSHRTAPGRHRGSRRNAASPTRAGSDDDPGDGEPAGRQLAGVSQHRRSQQAVREGVPR
jgi:hypothetical protein